MIHELPKLPYALNGLEPFISQKTLEFHFGKHHQAYLTNLNKLIKGTAFESASIEDIVKHSEGGIFNNGAQVYNHSFYFMALIPNGTAEPQGKLGEKIEACFGSFAAFKEEFSLAGASLFGSGWVWLVADVHGKLKIVKKSNAGNPITDGMIPLMTMDVWEHAYYLDTQNARPKYIENFWKLVNWKVIETRFNEL